MATARQLSPAIETLLTKLRQKHQVELNPLTIRGHALQILCLSIVSSIADNLRLVGRLREEERGLLHFSYNHDWLSGDGFPISVSLPLTLG